VHAIANNNKKTTKNEQIKSWYFIYNIKWL